MEVARLNNLSRVQRCGQIMGRADAGDMSSAQIFYPCMQVRLTLPRARKIKEKGKLDKNPRIPCVCLLFVGYIAVVTVTQ